MIKYPSIAEAILAVRKEQDGVHAQISYQGADIDTLIWEDGNPTNITKEQILAKKAELQTEYDAKQYQRDRSVFPDEGGYPSVNDQLDMMWHDKKDDTTTWEEAVQAIKDAHPKGDN